MWVDVDVDVDVDRRSTLLSQSGGAPKMLAQIFTALIYKVAFLYFL